MSSPRGEKTQYASEDETSSEVQQSPAPRAVSRRPRPKNKQMQRRKPAGGPLGGAGLDNLALDNVGNTVQGVTGGVTNTLGNVAGGALQQGGGGKDKSDTLRLRLDLNLDIEITLKARIHGDLELALLN